MKLLCEVRDDVECIAEEKNGKRNLYISGIFMMAEMANKNNRVYRLPTMVKEVARYNKDVIQNNNAVGELSHPQSANINLERVSHKIEELKMDGNNVVGKAKILETPMGNIAKGLIDGGVRLGVSSRGLGSLKPAKDGLMEVGEDFKLVTVDIVSDPSAPDAWVNAIMENSEWLWDEKTNGWKQVELVESVKKKVKRMTKRRLQETKYRLFENFLHHLVNETYK